MVVEKRQYWMVAAVAKRTRLTDDSSMCTPLKKAIRQCYPTNYNPADRLLLLELEFIEWLLRNEHIGGHFGAFFSGVSSSPLKTMIKPTISLAFRRTPSLEYD